MKECPCKKCDRKGCGSYHDVCKEYKGWSSEKEANNLKRYKESDSKHTNHPNKMTAFKRKMRQRK